MNRIDFKGLFEETRLVVLPVIHVLDDEQAEQNIQRAMDAGCPGVFLINHDFPYDRFIPIIRRVRQQFPNYWIGVNFLAVTGKIAFPILAELHDDGVWIDAYWADDARIEENKTCDDQTQAQEIASIREEGSWNGVYFGGTAFKKQRRVDVSNYHKSATLACGFMDVVTTSGIATGHSADIEKIKTFRAACNDTPVALASGITPENVLNYAPYVDCLLVATGINIKDDFYNIDRARLARLMEQIRR